MKYIRTDDGVYEDAGTDALGLRCVRYKGHKIALSQDDDKIVKEADSIEELLDKIIAVNQFNPQEHFTLAYKPKQPSNGMDVYGCIWTTGAYGEPILKAVTKPMDSKGEFELL